MTTAAPAPAPFPGDPPADLALARAHKLSPEAWARATERLRRAPTYAKLGVLSLRALLLSPQAR
jgi:phosphoribosylformylglycinamidine synthase